jgi:hypothetical protein
MVDETGKEGTKINFTESESSLLVAIMSNLTSDIQVSTPESSFTERSLSDKAK